MSFRLGTLQSILNTRLKPLVPELERQIGLTVTIGHSTDLFEDLLSGRFDAVFAIDRPQSEEVGRANAVAEQVMLIYPDAHCPVDSQSDLQDLPFVTFAEGCSYRRRGLSWMAEAGLEPIAVEVVPTYPDIIRKVVDGQGFGAIPGSVLAASPMKTNVQADPIQGPNGKVWVELLWRKDADPKAVEAIRKAMGF
jgi:DNA-binding transcriptional LysR family regulator